MGDAKPFCHAWQTPEKSSFVKSIFVHKNPSSLAFSNSFIILHWPLSLSREIMNCLINLMEWKIHFITFFFIHIENESNLSLNFPTNEKFKTLWKFHVRKIYVPLSDFIRETQCTEKNLLTNRRMRKKLPLLFRIRCSLLQWTLWILKKFWMMIMAQEQDCSASYFMCLF